MTAWLFVMVGVALTLGTSLFVAAEFALVTLDRVSVEQSVAAGNQRSKPVLKALKQLSTQLSACQIGITFTTLLLGFLAQPGLATLLKGPLQNLGLSGTATAGLSVLLALLLATGFSMIFGELVPKNLALATPLHTAALVAPGMRIATWGFKPLIRILNGSANILLRRLGVEPQEELSGARTPQELASLVRRSAAAGTLGRNTAELVTRSLDFAGRTAADVMTPRLQCASIERDRSAADVIRLARNSGYSRFLVIGQGIDDVVGVVHLKRAISVPLTRRGEVPAAALMSPHLSVPETVGLDPLLVQLRAEAMQFALVVDEYGGTSGVVTLEDVVEELVGEVADEHDRARLRGRRLRDGSWLVPGLWRPDEVRNRINVDIPERGPYETVAGFVMSQLGQVPKLGDAVARPGGQLVVSRMQGRRIERLRWIPNTEDSERTS